MQARWIIAFFAVSVTTPLPGQSLTDELRLGDSAFSERDAERALLHYERAASIDTTNFDAAWKASRSAADLESSARGQSERHAALLRQAERYARRAVGLRPQDAEARFSMARALGLAARSVGVRQRVRYANEIRDHALECVRIAPTHSGCLHVLGAWNAEVMRLSGVERFLARRVLGGRAFSSASWAEAVRYLEAAVAADSDRMAHRVELAEIYVSIGRPAEARRQYEAVLRMKLRDFGDEAHRDKARDALRRLP